MDFYFDLSCYLRDRNSIFYFIIDNIQSKDVYNFYCKESETLMKYYTVIQSDFVY